MARLQCNIDDGVLDEFKRKYYRLLGPTVERLMVEDMRKEEE